MADRSYIARQIAAFESRLAQLDKEKQNIEAGDQVGFGVMEQVDSLYRQVSDWHFENQSTDR